MSEERKQGKISEAVREAQSIIEAAEIKAARILEKAELAYEEARTGGRQEGIEIGEKKVLQSAVRLIEQSSEASDVLSEEIAKLALKITEKILQKELELDPAHAVQIVKSALKQSIPGTKVTITLHPKDAETVEQHPGNLVPESCTLEILRDEEMKRGGCTVKTDFGEVDMRVESMLSNIAAKLGVVND